MSAIATGLAARRAGRRGPRHPRSAGCHRDPGPARRQSHRSARGRGRLRGNPVLEPPGLHPRAGRRRHHQRAGRHHRRASALSPPPPPSVREGWPRRDDPPRWRPARPLPALAGTGRLADDLYLIAHHERTGRLLLSPRAVGLGLAGALLGELVLSDAVSLTAGRSVPAAPSGEALTAAVAGQVAAETPPRPVADWLAFLARTAPGDVAARLAGAGYLAPVRRRPWQAARLVPVDPDCAFAPIARLKAALHLDRPGDAQAITLAGLAAACGLGPRLALYLPAGARTRTDALVSLLAPELHEVIAQTQAAVDAAVLAHRM